MGRRKRARVDVDESRTNINDLPDEILHHIISFLPIKDAGRTSLLSKKWRYVLGSIPDLILDEANPENSRWIGHSFMTFVETLLSYRGSGSPIHRFHLNCGPAVESSRLRRSIRYVTFLGVQEMDLKIDMPWFHKLPLRLLTCPTLRVLKLQLCRSFFFGVPENILLPSLKVLHLSDLIRFLDQRSVDLLFSRCPVLEDLVFKCDMTNIRALNISIPTLKRLELNGYSFNEYVVNIEAPRLVCFNYNDFLNRKAFNFINVQSLAEVYLDIAYIQRNEGDNDCPAIVDNLMKPMSNNVRSLHLSGDFLATVAGICHRFLPPMYSLTYLRLFCCGITGCMKNLPDVLAKYKNLEKLELEKLPTTRDSRSIFDPPENVPPCLQYRLREIEILSFQGSSRPGMKVIEYFLKSASVLEILTVNLTGTADRREKMNITRDLRKLPRLSKKCRVLVL